jgi:coproporphyrinogen III oxidase-like Fe-S oxidoreductase
MLGERLWKPLLHRAVTGQVERMRLVPGDVPWPTSLKRPGLYLHVPFCRDLCPFCPYNRFKYEEERYRRYERAVREEIDLLAPSLAGARFCSLYVGGGTPTVDPGGLERILGHLAGAVGPIGETCVELHPGEMDDAVLERLRRAGVTMISIGAQSLADDLLRRLGRSHDGTTALDAIRRARRAGFASVNVDLMFSLPGQTEAAWEEDVRRVLDAGADQLSTYPLFGFSYSDQGAREGLTSVRRPPGGHVRRMLARTDALARQAGLARCAVWSWLRPGPKKFSSVSRHHYVGFGPSAASMIGSHFHVNTFDVDAYAAALPSRRPVALAMPLAPRQEMAYWLYWRAYELFAGAEDFADLFPGASLEGVFGPLFAPFRALGLMRRTAGGFEITDAGAYWIHRLQSEYSLAYIERLWGRCRREPWPAEVRL